jgi:hypothetical protein
VLDQEEAVRVLGGCERRNRFIAPIIRWVLSRLLGWHYDGYEGYRRLAAQLPFIAFRPRSSPIASAPLPAEKAPAGIKRLSPEALGLDR